MSPDAKKRPMAGALPEIATATGSTATIPRPDDNTSDPRQRRRASRDLDQLCGIVRPGHVCTCPDHWSDVGLSLGMVERDYLGRDLAGVGA